MTHTVSPLPSSAVRPRRARIALAAWIGALLVWPAIGHATGSSLDPPPMVMILLDTSGSMEFTETDGFVPDCTVPNPALNRAAMARQLLTGTFGGATCSIDYRLAPPTREDLGYPIPHVLYQLTGTPPQAPDGLIDINGSRIKFGFASFDSNPNQSVQSHGGYSYQAKGIIKETSVNLGIRNANAPTGGLLPPTLSDLPEVIAAANALVERQIAEALPYGATPISPALVDLDSALGRDLDFIADPFVACRKRFIILITDGKPTLGEGTDGYPTSPVVAANLYAQGIRVFVVGFNVSGDNAREMLDDIAYSGSGGTIPKAFVADSPHQLTIVLASLFQHILDRLEVRGGAAFTTKTLTPRDVLYQFDVGFRPDPHNNINQVGVLEQSIYRCDANCKLSSERLIAGVCQVFSIANALKGQLQRRIFTSVSGVGGLVPFDPNEDVVTSDMLGIPRSGVLPALSLKTLPNGIRVCGLDPLGLASVPATRALYRRRLMGNIRADTGSCRSLNPLGAIFHSSPKIQSNLDGLRISDPSFRIYREQVKGRPTVLWVATHEGLIHGFRVDRSQLDPSFSTADFGKEIVAYIPRFVLPRLHTLSDRMDFALDGKPSLSEILLLRDDPNATAADTAQNWRSVLIVPGGFRTVGVVALDVTDPVNPKLLWEITDRERCAPGGGNVVLCRDNTQSENDFRLLGHISSRVTMGSVFVRLNGVDQERAVAVIPGGAPRPGVAGSGHVIYVVDLLTGKKLAEFKTGSSQVIDPSPLVGGIDGLDFPMVGAPACFNTFPGTLMTRCFIGDGGGQIWYLRFLGTDPDGWELRFFHDAYRLPGQGTVPSRVAGTGRRPIVEDLALALGPNGGRLVVVYHTSSVDDVHGRPPLPARMVSLTEDLVLDASGASAEVTATLNWFKLFPLDALTGPPVIFNSNVFVTSFQRNQEDICAVGSGRLWGFHYLRSKTPQSTDPVPGLDSDGDVATADAVERVDLGPGIPMGVEIVQRPTCAGNNPVDFDTNAGLGSLRPSSPELVIQRAGGSMAANQMPKHGMGPEINRTSRKLAALPRGVFISSWGSLLK